MILDDDRPAKRRKRLITELADEGVDLIEDIVTRDQDLNPRPSGTLSTAEADEVAELLLDELLYARHPPVHEGRTPAYGAIITSGDRPDVDPYVADQLHMISPAHDEVAVADVRELANGLTTFVVRSEIEHGLAVLDRADELSLMRLCTEHLCWIVQRHPSGVIKVFGRERLLLYENDSWLSRPYAHTRWMHLMHATGTHGLVGASILDFCLHVLSARHVGATLVWLLEEPTDGLDAHLAKAMRPTGVTLSVTENDNTEALSSLLASVDGACILDASGRVLGLEAFLKNSDEAVARVSSHGGTRHNSAARFSFDVGEAVVFVVSADGPVTVFSDGTDLLRLDDVDPSSTTMTTVMPELAYKVTSWVQHVECPTCHKRVIGEFERVDGWTDTETENCPVCGHADLIRGRCFRIYTRVAKPWEPETATATWGF